MRQESLTEGLARWFHAAPGWSPLQTIHATGRTVYGVLRSMPFPIYLAVLCGLTFGVLIPFLGFYWDDWPILWWSHVVEPGELRYLEIHRPLAGWWYMMLGAILGRAPIHWQLFNLLNRWLIGVAAWWSLRKIWPQQVQLPLWTAALVVVYPGFSQQFISVNTSRHFLGLILFLGSIGLMVQATKAVRNHVRLTALSVLLLLLSMLTTDYYYSLEALRPIFLFIAFGPEGKALRPRMIRAVRAWAPYLAVVTLIYLWRFVWVGEVFYPFQSPGASEPSVGAGSFLALIGQDLLNVGGTAWARAFDIPDISAIGTRSVFLYWGIVAAVLVITAGVFLLGRAQAKESAVTIRRSMTAAAIGLFALAAGGVPSWATGLAINLHFPQDRLTLPMMLGASLLPAALLSAIRPRRVGALFLTLLVGFSAGRNFQIASNYRWDWVRQKSFLWQLVWRIPDLERGTLIMSQDFPLDFETDNSLTAIVNWIYAPEDPGDPMPFMVYDLKLRLGSRFPDLTEGHSIRHEYWTFANGRSFVFEGSTSQALVIHHAYPACLRVIQPVYDGHMTGLWHVEGLAPYVDMAFDLSKPDLILQGPGQAGEILTDLLGLEPEHGWCYYYQKADLARQSGDWTQVHALARQALALDQSPNHSSEYILFIEALARQGEVREARRLTQVVLERAPGLDGMLCDAWQDAARSLAPQDRYPIVEGIRDLLPCISATEPTNSVRPSRAAKNAD